MLEKLPFHPLILSAWQATLSKKLPWIFGILLAIVGVVGNRVSLALPNTTSPPEFLNSISEMPSETRLFFIFIFFILFSFEIFGKSNLIVSLSSITGKADLPNHPNNSRAMTKNFFQAFLLKCLALLFLLAVVSIFSLPLLIASSKNPGVMGALLNLSLLVFIPIAIVVFFIWQFALFYLLLSPLKIRGSIETGGALFSRFIFQSLLFGIFSFILTILFTFFVNTLILSIITLSKKMGIPFEETSIALIVGLAFFTWFSIFQQALWLAFFKSIASQDKTKEFAKEKESAFDNQTLPETPPAQ